jgi:LysM repeat protein
MNKRSSASARVFAVTALVAALVIAIIAIAGSVGGGDSDGVGGSKNGSGAAHETPAKRIPATYEVKSGDTLIAIAHRMGIPVARILELNPEVDPQILVAGEQLKLR